MEEWEVVLAHVGELSVPTLVMKQHEITHRLDLMISMNVSFRMFSDSTLRMASSNDETAAVTT